MSNSKNMSHALLSAIFVAISVSSVTAQEFYIGAMTDSGEGEFTSGSSASTFLNSNSAVAGLRVETNTQFYFGGEVESSASNRWEDDDGNITAINSIMRYRAVAGMDLNGLSIFVTAGRTAVDTDSTGRFNGQSIGLGAEVPISDTLSVRLEAFQEAVDQETGLSGYSFDNQVFRAGAIINF